ncbi:ABC transporter substrate-binding protein [Nocardia sp. NBC_00565]|uniref:ABC transporter substrate-binding protein n=1 Tax=Nocardia sp. NBC_00565 TaxID=2975993 RepID=UPI002E802582|nr:ABC transporter substrate-binding protein [Nocardia sp. NBC_00565]WUC00506.1 ABC transporter substrate-binding protein [Nocardia sp. NBC_00565]
MSSSQALVRRNFLRNSGIAAFAILGTGALAACTSAVSEQKAGGKDDAQPVRGGTLKVGVPTDVIPANLLTNSGSVPAVIGLVYETLVRYPNDKLEPGPLLAKSWTLAEDGLSLALELREDVTFHTGRPFTAKDVEFSLRTYADPKWSAQLKSTAAAITEYDITAPNRIVLKFAHPIGNIFDLLDTAPILDSETAAQLSTGEKFIGTGAFKLTQRTPNSLLVFERNEQYRVPERPYLDRVEISIIPDSQALVNALKSGQIAVAHSLNYRDNENFAKSDGFTTVSYDGAELQIYVGANVAQPALADVKVRQAIAYAIDRERIIAEVFRNAGYPVSLPWPKSSPAFDNSRNNTYTRDIAKAKQILAQTTTPPNLSLSYDTSYPYSAATAQIVQANLAEIGIGVTLDPIEPATFVKKLIGAEFPGLWVTTHSWAQFTPSTLTVSAYPFNARKNSSHFESPAYVDAADAAWKVKQGNSAEAIKAYQAVSNQLLENLFLIEIGVYNQQASTTRKVHGLNWTKRRETVLTDAFLS